MNATKRRASDVQIMNATAAFWGVISDRFPEMKHGDTQSSGEDEAALALWANGGPGDRPIGMIKLSLPSSIPLERVTQAVNDGMEAARTSLPGVMDAHRETAFNELMNCARHVIHYNVPSPDDEAGFFSVHVYASEEEWESGKGASQIHENISDQGVAVDMANSDDHAGAYEVTVQAQGEHDEYESGEVVFSRFDRNTKNSRPRP